MSDDQIGVSFTTLRDLAGELHGIADEDSSAWRPAQARGIILMLREIDWTAVAGGRRTLECALLHYCRRQSRLPDATARQPEEVAEAIHHALSCADGHPALASLLHEVPSHGLGSRGAREVLLSCAVYIDAGEWRVFGRTLSIPEDEVEIRGAFPELIGFSEMFLEPGEGTDVVEIVADYIDQCHPHCRWILPQLVGELGRALAAYPAENLMQQAFDEKISMASVTGLTWTEWFGALSAQLMQHMTECHAAAEAEDAC
ncbi:MULTISPECIES: hypothetical protein [unclassified Streptomyces]|uniref:hypothetical protein n=1 Tax=unclassified Streptomyces TaxID=2593676 RepID=UPI003823965F